MEMKTEFAYLNTVIDRFIASYPIFAEL